MGISDIIFWPFAIAFGSATILVAALLLAFWIWMIVDCAKRKFKNDVEKIVWIIVIVLGHWVGSLIYFIAIKLYNPKGLYKN